LNGGYAVAVLGRWSFVQMLVIRSMRLLSDRYAAFVSGPKPMVVSPGGADDEWNNIGASLFRVLQDSRASP
jgi:hypothetical protein